MKYYDYNTLPTLNCPKSFNTKNPKNQKLIHNTKRRRTRHYDTHRISFDL